MKYIGVTGHGWNVAAMHRRSLERFDFDSILMPWNWFAAHHKTYAPDFERTMALATKRNLAVQTIKGVARGPWAAGAKRDRSTWYQPLEAMDDIRPAVHWVLSRPGVFLLSAGDVELLPSILKAASEPVVKPSDEAMAALMRQAVQRLETTPPSVDPAILAENIAFLKWLKSDHFVFLGARDYDYPRAADGD